MSNQLPPSAARFGRLRSGLLHAAGAAAIGLASAVAALGAGELVAYATGAGTAPVIAVGSAAIDLTPTPLKEYAVRTFGTHDKAVLLGGIYLTMALLAALAGLLAVRRPLAGAAVFAAFGGLGAWAALSRPGATAADCAPSLAAALVGSAAVLVLAGSWRRASVPDPGPRPEPMPADPKPAESPERPGMSDSPQPANLLGDRSPSPERSLTSRRTVLTATAVTFTAGALAAMGGRVLTDRRFDVTAARDAVRLPAPAEPLPPLAAAVHPDVPGLSPFTTPNADFYRVDTALTLPRIDPRDWTLRIHGLVDRPQLLTFDDLLKEPLEELDHTLSCVSNEVGGPYVGTTRWLGAALPALLRRAGVRSGADQLVGRSQDGMTIGTPLESVLDGRSALLAVAMNGEALPLAHGFPCRTVVPGFYGYTSATKWLVDLEVTTFAAFDPYWVRRGWDRTGAVRTASRIEVPAPFAKVPAGDVDLAGTAWATHRGIAAVELRVDEGPWHQAELATDAGPDLWRQWSYRWSGAPPGTHRIEVRATDATGAVQPEQRAAPFPAGATGWHSTVVTVT
ncbi:molybdopterin-dependent oxidoreductase [Streptomyces sp. TLI_171]|uniref:molybdopterin-dependent oxidoreductase n=1 Tax=Streptomyces sp. TLI_171 TaxID=1938859 RepID=UPI000C434F43|nr:molybdopterin-dependent oxidoreductase [Streptomyces sp. TLI_171]RKE17974.1 DMSO/TMAO reductase YedYZ molybdopterin-dependent catalytic subunit [Streptomyces sp. TLI_171]